MKTLFILFFELDDIYLLSLFLDDFSFNISSDSDQFIFRLTFLRTSSWLRTDMYWEDGVSKTEGKRLRKWIDFMTRGSFVSIDHFNFYSRSEILCRYTTSFGNWVIFNSSVFNDTFQCFISIFFFAWTHDQLLD